MRSPFGNAVWDTFFARVYLPWNHFEVLRGLSMLGPLEMKRFHQDSLLFNMPRSMVPTGRPKQRLPFIFSSAKLASRYFGYLLVLAPVPCVGLEKVGR